MTAHEDAADPTKVAAVLLGLLEAVDRGDISASVADRERLAGAVVVAQAVSIRPSC